MYETLSCTLHVLGLSAFQDTAKVLKNKSDVDLVGRDGEEGWQCGERGLLSQIKGITTTELVCHAKHILKSRNKKGEKNKQQTYVPPPPHINFFLS